jgi:hypothetical protein
MLMGTSGGCLVLAIDPDTRASGVALVKTRRVLALGLAHNPNYHAGAMQAVDQQFRALGTLLRKAMQVAGAVDRCVIEIPMDYGQKRYADPNDLMRLSMISGSAAGVLVEFCPRVQAVCPYEWKGQRTKMADHKNTLRYFGWKFAQRTVCALPTFTIPKDVMLLSAPPTTQDHYSELADAMGLGIYGLAREGAQ